MTQQEMQIKTKKELKQPGEPTKPERHYIPAVDIYETETAVTVMAEMPGVAKDGVTINLENDTLTIIGATPEIPSSNETVLLREYETGHYLRRFSISEIIDREKISAGMTNGVLTVILPKVEPARPKKIEVTAG